MKVIVLLTSLLASASAFSPLSVSRPATSLNIIKNSYLNSLDAERIVIEECSQEECTMVEGVHDDEGWHLTGELGAENTSVNILMMETGDTE